MELETERLLIRPWREADKAPFADLNADPRVMEFLLRTLPRAASDDLADRLARTWRETGISFQALEEKASRRFIGLVGLLPVEAPLPRAPGVEIGWRLAFEAWGRGYASEAARACLAFGFAKRGLDEIVSYTAAGNRRSAAVMKRIGMERLPAEDFDHPAIAPGHPLRRHVLYRLGREEWAAGNPPSLLKGGLPQ